MIDWVPKFPISVITALSAWWIYSRLLRGTAQLIGVLFAVLIGVMGYFFSEVFKYIAILFFIVGIMIEILRLIHKKDYAHSRFLYEGGGIKRGLSPLEVGTLNDLPASALFALGLIDLLDKGFLNSSSIKDGGVVVKVVDEIKQVQNTINPKTRRESRQKIAFQKMKELTGEEDVLLETIGQNPNKFIEEIPIQPWIDVLQRSVDNKLRGFDPFQTKTYYKDFISHRLNGVKNGYFNAAEYYGWSVLSLYLGINGQSLAENILKNTRPAWIGECESLMEWVKLMKSISW